MSLLQRHAMMQIRSDSLIGAATLILGLGHCAMFMGVLCATYGSAADCILSVGTAGGSLHRCPFGRADWQLRQVTIW
jgi:hypothetical protein